MVFAPLLSRLVRDFFCASPAARRALDAALMFFSTVPLTHRQRFIERFDMRFQVSYKGLPQYIGSLLCANSYLKEKWGSVVRAYEVGVKLVAVSD